MNPEFHPKKYPSAVDAWLAAILIGVPLLLISCGVYAMFIKGVRPGVPVLAAGLLTAVLMYVLSFPCVYTLEENLLIIRCGIIKYKVPYAEIVSIEKSGSLWSAPALSIRRVKIETTTGSYLVSPRDRDVFLADLLVRIRN